MNTKRQAKNVVKIKDIMRLFLQYEIEFFPIVDGRSNLRGLLYKNKLINDATDMAFLKKTFSSMLEKYILYPEEPEFLKIVSELKNSDEFPVINLKGEVIELWKKNNLINIYYKINNTKKEITQKTKTVPDIKQILDLLPINLLIIDSKKNIVYASREFIKTFDFKIEILINQNIIKIFPEIITTYSKNTAYPKLNQIYYQHENRNYGIINFNKYKKEHIGYIFFSNTDNNNMIINSISAKTEEKRKENTEKKTKLPDIIHNEEKNIIEITLKKNNWNISQTAKQLKIPRQTLQYKINKYKIMINVTE